MADLQVDVTAVAAATAQLRAVADRVSDLTPDRSLRAVADAVPGGALADAALDQAGQWAAEVQELARRVIEHAALARAACEALVQVDRELGGPR